MLTKGTAILRPRIFLEDSQMEMRMEKRMELLAPAGSPETLRAVCAAGADAVYVGGQSFGARAYAKNFTQEELLDAIDQVHMLGKKLHLTVNILLKTKELEEQLYDYLLPYYERGLDAVIVQDAGVFSFIKTHFPNMELHASTQMTIAGADGARFLKNAGADRVVLARELSLPEIAHIRRTVDVPLECFAHGALCYSYSGQCLFSSMLGGRSGNRGRCAQPCRLPYQVSAEGREKGCAECYPLSLKDLCTIDLLPELREAGVCSLKIEGRMKQTAYAAGVTAIYRKYLDLCESGEPYQVTDDDRAALLMTGNRSGFTAGYLRGEKGASMVSLHSPKHTAQTEETAQPFSFPKRLICGTCHCKKGSPAQLTVRDAQSGCEICVSDGELQAAKNAPATKEEIAAVLRQTGDTPFEFDRLTVTADDDCFVPKQFLKRLRRNALAELREAILAPYRRIAPQGGDADENLFLKKPSDETENRAVSVPLTQDLLVVCDTFGQLECCANKDYITTLALQLQGIPRASFAETVARAGALCASHKKKLLLSMPSVLRQTTAEFYEAEWKCIENIQESTLFAGFLAKTYDTLGFLDRMGVPASDVWLDEPLYTFSDRAYFFFASRGYRYRTLPYELTAGELRQTDVSTGILTIYGHTPFMVSSQCVNRTMYGCDQTEKRVYLTDRYGKQLPVKNYCAVCCNVVYNAVPTVLFGIQAFSQVQKLAPARLRMDLTVEDRKETEAVLAAYEAQVLGCDVHGPVFDGASTRGHFKNGVE